MSQLKDEISLKSQNVMCCYCLCLIVPERVRMQQKEASALEFHFCYDVNCSDCALKQECEESHQPVVGGEDCFLNGIGLEEKH